jgi:hypothetical protein
MHKQKQLPGANACLSVVINEENLDLFIYYVFSIEGLDSEPISI